MPNQFVIAQARRGNLSQAQERALINFATTLGRAKFAEYRQQAGAFAPIPKLSKAEAYRLIAMIVEDLERETET